MGFYDLEKSERVILVATMGNDILESIKSGNLTAILKYFSDDDTYIRKSAYLAMGRLFVSEPSLKVEIITILHGLSTNPDAKIRQTVVNAAGEIGKSDFPLVQIFFDTSLFDSHHSVRNAVIGSMKKMGEKNPVPVLEWSRKYLHHPDKEIRREICHGIELRGRTHPQDILPLLEELQHDRTKRVRRTLVHVIGQIAYKKGCLETVLSTILNWENQSLVCDAIEEIIDVHHRYRNFSFYTQQQAREVVATNCPEQLLKAGSSK